MKPLVVTARLAMPLNGDPPHLDSILEYAAGMRARPRERHRINSAAPPPELGEVAIPIARKLAGIWLVACCSSPVTSLPAAVSQTRIRKSIDAGNALLLAEDERRAITATAGGFMAKKWLPRKISLVPSVAWACVGCPDGLRDLLADVHALGKEVGHGHGKISRWDIEPAEGDFSWFAPCGESLVLMRPLPMPHEETDWYEGEHREWTLPTRLVGWRESFGAVSPPYWHSLRQTRIAVPC